MVESVRPVKFYGSSLPRPRYYTDVKYNDYRVDPPVPVMDPFLSWANEAHWSMGGLSFQRHRLQGRIEGNVEKLKAEHDKFIKNSIKSDTKSIRGLAPHGTGVSSSPSLPPAPVAMKKRRRLVGLIDDDEDETESEERENGGGVRRRSARKLYKEFNDVATENGLEKRKVTPVKSPAGSGSEPEGMASRTRGRKLGKEEDPSDVMVKDLSRSNTKKKKLLKVASENQSPSATVTRSSPRLVKRRLN